MLEIRNLSKYYGRLAANDHISLRIPDEKIALLVGPNGAGKSTLIKSVMGLLRYDGEVYLDGVLNKSREGRGKIGYVPEIPHLYDLLTVWEHLEFTARMYKLKDWEEEAERLLERFELSDKRNKLGTELSKGMQQKVSICCAILPKPRFILFDEPMIGLDPHGIKMLKESFAELKEEKISMLISTHILDTVDELWDIVCIMMNGKIVAVAEHEELEAHGESLEELFFRVTEPYGEIAEDMRLGKNSGSSAVLEEERAAESPGRVKAGEKAGEKAASDNKRKEEGEEA